MLQTLSDLKTLLAKAKACEINKNFEKQRTILKSFWLDIKQDPFIDDLPIELQAEALRVCGHFLSNIGRAKGVEGKHLSREDKSLQERGKDMLMRAVDIFTELDDSGKDYSEVLAEAKAKLALCYWNAGDRDNAYAILKEAEITLGENLYTDTYIQIKINQLIVLHHSDGFNECLDICRIVKSFVDKCSSIRLKIEFYNQASMLHTQLRDYDKAIKVGNISLNYAKQINSPRLVAKILNNMAYVYSLNNEVSQSLVLLKESKAIYKNLRDRGFLANALDTQANIELTAGKKEEALLSINESIEILENFDEAKSLVEAYWTKAQVLLSLERLPEALDCMYKLRKTAQSQISEYIAEKYNNLFAEKLVIKQFKSEQFSKIAFFDTEQPTLNEPDCDYLMFVPLEAAKIFKLNSPVLIAVERKIKGGLIVAAISSFNYVISELITESIIDMQETYILNNGEPVFDFEVIGSIVAIAPYSEDTLIFENI